MCLSGTDKKGSWWRLSVTMLIIIIAVYLLLLVWNPGGGVTISASCFARPGFYCGGSNYYSNGTATFVVGQDTNANWSSVEIMFVQNSIFNKNITTLPSWNTNSTQINGGLQEGVNKFVSIHISGSVPIGTIYNGSLWAKYQINSNTGIQYVEIGSVTVKAK